MKLPNIFNCFRRRFRRNLSQTSSPNTTETTFPDTTETSARDTTDTSSPDTTEVGWCDLPSDILRSVESRLELVDQIRLRLVCKSWSGIEETKSNHKLPWILMLNNTSQPYNYYLYDLRHEKLYYVTIEPRTTRSRLERFHWIYISAIKLGWLLMNPMVGKMLLFNIFNQKLIILPQTPGDLLGMPPSTFRYCPKSKRFVVYAAYSSVTGLVIIKTWKSGDGEWESYNFAAACPGFIFKIEVVGEALYCIFNTGVVGCFNERSKSWSVVLKYSEEGAKLFPSLDTIFYHHRCVTFEFKGELLMMDLHPFRRFVIRRLDRSQGRWVEVVDFHKCAVFLAGLNPVSVLCSEQFVKPSDPVATRVHYFKPRCSSVSSMDYNRLHKTSQDFLNIKFPWRQEEHPCTNLPFYWIEPSL